MSMIIFAPPRSGKTQNAEALRKHYRLKTIVDEWCPGDPLPADALALTNVACPEAVPLTQALGALRPST